MSDNIVAREDVSFDLATELDSEFRVVLTEGRRRGVRLEKLYWRLLDDIAGRRGKRRSRLAAEILEARHEGAANAASSLRGFIARTLESEYRALQETFGETAVIELMQHAPVPAFAITRKKKLVRVNPEFIHLMRVTSGSMRESPSPDIVQLTFDTAVEELFSRTSDSTSTHCGYILNLGGRQKRGRVKIAAVPPMPARMLVGYIES